MKRPTELIEKAKGFKSTDPVRVLAEYAVSLESPRKTVSDAVDWNEEQGFGETWRYPTKDCITYSDTGFAYSSTDYTEREIICTREEFEKEVERRKGEEWTHKSKGGKLCKVVYEDNETQLVYFSDGSRSCYWDAEHFAVKRKTISKAEAWDKLNNTSGDYLSMKAYDAVIDILSRFEVK